MQRREKQGTSARPTGSSPSSDLLSLHTIYTIWRWSYTVNSFTAFRNGFWIEAGNQFTKICAEVFAAVNVLGYCSPASAENLQSECRLLSRSWDLHIAAEMLFKPIFLYVG